MDRAAYQQLLSTSASLDQLRTSSPLKAPLPDAPATPRVSARFRAEAFTPSAAVAKHVTKSARAHSNFLRKEVQETW